MPLKVYGIPTCDTCRKARKFLNEHSIEYTWVDTRENPPSKSTVLQWVQELGNKALRNTSGGSYRALPKEKDTWSDTQWVDAFAADAMLIKRPLFEKDGRALFTGFKGSSSDIFTQLG